MRLFVINEYLSYAVYLGTRMYRNYSCDVTARPASCLGCKGRVIQAAPYAVQCNTAGERGMWGHIGEDWCPFTV